jgi:SAM-dependent methyltransferase
VKRAAGRVTRGGVRRPGPERVERGTLEHYTNPALYTRTYRSRREDVEYYRALAERVGGPVLEYGIGNGRIALPIVRAGIDVVGIDLSEAMLADLERRHARLARRYRHHLSWVQGDMRSVRLERRFALVIAPFNAMLHLYERRDVERFLACVRGHLAPGAPFVFDVSIPVAADLALDPEEWDTGPRIRHPITGELTRYRERFEYDAVRQVLCVDMQIASSGSAPTLDIPLLHRQFFPAELEALLHYNGFCDIRFTADFSERAPESDVDSLVVTARAAGLARRGNRT